MAVPAGIDISVTFAAGYTTKVTSITLNYTAAFLDTTGSNEDNDFDTGVGGRRKLAGSYTCKWDSTINITGSSSSTDNYAALGGAGSAATFTFSASSGNTVVVPIIITGIDATASIDSANEVAFTWEANGAPTARSVG